MTPIVSDDIRARLNNATLEQIEYWIDRVFDAATLNAVFEEH